MEEKIRHGFRGKKHTVYIGFGSNIGCGRRNILQSWKMLAEEPGITIGVLSSPYTSTPVDMDSERLFTNCVGCVESSLPPERLLDVLLRIEKQCGRDRSRETAGIHADRIIDLDLLFYGSMIQRDARLILPHPGVTKRLFVLTPIAEIAPEYIHPVYQHSMCDLLKKRMEKNALLSPGLRESVTRCTWDTETA